MGRKGTGINNHSTLGSICGFASWFSLGFVSNGKMGSQLHALPQYHGSYKGDLGFSGHIGLELQTRWLMGSRETRWRISRILGLAAQRIFLDGNNGFQERNQRSVHQIIPAVWILAQTNIATCTCSLELVIIVCRSES